MLLPLPTLQWALINVGSLAVWAFLYWFSLQHAKHPEWSSRAITLLHGFVATVVGLAQGWCPAFNKHCFSYTVTQTDYALMAWSWGYFAFDTMWCIWYWPKNKLMHIHHISALTAISLYMRKECTGCTFPLSLAFMEITNPFLQLRWFLRFDGHNEKLIFYAIEWTYFILFVGVRGVLGTYITYYILKADTGMFDYESKIISIVLYAVSLGLISEVLGYVVYKYKVKFDEWMGVLEEIRQHLNDFWCISDQQARLEAEDP